MPASPQPAMRCGRLFYGGGYSHNLLLYTVQPRPRQLIICGVRWYFTFLAPDTPPPACPWPEPRRRASQTHRRMTYHFYGAAHAVVRRKKRFLCDPGRLAPPKACPAVVALEEGAVPPYGYLATTGYNRSRPHGLRGASWWACYTFPLILSGSSSSESLAQVPPSAHHILRYSTIASGRRCILVYRPFLVFPSLPLVISGTHLP